MDSLRYYTKTQQVVKVNFIVEFQSIPMNFHTLLHTNPLTTLYCTLNRFFYPCLFCNVHWSFKNIGSLNYADLPNVNTFLCVIWKYNHEYSSLEKSLSIGKLPSSQWQIQFFQNSYICLKAQILSLATNLISCFLWSDVYCLAYWV